MEVFRVTLILHDEQWSDLVEAEDTDKAVEKAQVHVAKLWQLWDDTDPSGGIPGEFVVTECYNIHFAAFAHERAVLMYRLLLEASNVGYENYKTPGDFVDWFAGYQKKVQAALEVVK